MNKVFKLHLGGSERSLLFGSSGFFEYIKEASGIDPLEWILNLDKNKGIIESIDTVACIVYAGLNTFLDSQDQENVDFKKVRKWVKALTSEEMSEVSTFAFAAFPQGEVVEESTEEKKTMAAA